MSVNGVVYNHQPVPTVVYLENQNVDKIKQNKKRYVKQNKKRNIKLVTK